MFNMIYTNYLLTYITCVSSHTLVMIIQMFKKLKFDILNFDFWWKMTPLNRTHVLRPTPTLIPPPVMHVLSACMWVNNKTQ